MTTIVTKTGLEVITQVPTIQPAARVTKAITEVMGTIPYMVLSSAYQARVTKSLVEVGTRIPYTNTNPPFLRVTKLLSEVLISADEPYIYNLSTEIGNDQYGYGYLYTAGKLATAITGLAGANVQMWFKYLTTASTGTNTIFAMSAGEVAGINLAAPSNSGLWTANGFSYSTHGFSNPLSGANDALLATVTAASGTFTAPPNTISVVSGQTYFFSAWVKGSGGSVGKTVSLNFSNINGTFANQVANFTLTSGWQQISLSATALATNQSSFRLYGQGLGTANLATADQIFIYNLQVSQSSSQLPDQINTTAANLKTISAFYARIDPITKNLIVKYSPSTTSGDDLAEINTGVPLTTDTWYFLSMNADYFNKTYTTYLDGTAINTYSYTGSTTAFTPSGTYITPDLFGIGLQDSKAGNFSLHMRLIDFRVWGTSRSNVAIGSDMTFNFIPRLSPTLLRYYKFNDPGGTIKSIKTYTQDGAYYTYPPNDYLSGTPSTDIPVDTGDLNPATLTFDLPYQISFLDIITHTFTLPYSLGKLAHTTHTFDLPYSLGKVGTQTHTFQFPYHLDELGPDNLTFQFKYNLAKIGGTSRTFDCPYTIDKYSGDIMFSFEMPYQYPLISHQTHGFNLPYTIFEVTGTVQGFDLPYHLDRIHSNTYTFNLPYSNSLMSVVDRTFTLQYDYDELSAGSASFTLPYSIDEVSLTDVYNVYNLQFTEISPAHSTLQYRFQYQLSTATHDNYGFEFPYQIDLNKTNYNFQFPYKNNVTPIVYSSTFNLKYGIDRIQASKATFQFPYSLTGTTTSSTIYNFKLPYNYSRQIQTTRTYKLRYNIEKYVTNVSSFSFPYIVRKSQNEITGLVVFYEQ